MAAILVPAYPIPILTGNEATPNLLKNLGSNTIYLATDTATGVGGYPLTPNSSVRIDANTSMYATCGVGLASSLGILANASAADETNVTASGNVSVLGGAITVSAGTVNVGNTPGVLPQSPLTLLGSGSTSTAPVVINPMSALYRSIVALVGYPAGFAYPAVRLDLIAADANGNGNFVWATSYNIAAVANTPSGVTAVIRVPILAGLANVSAQAIISPNTAPPNPITVAIYGDRDTPATAVMGYMAGNGSAGLLGSPGYGGGILGQIYSASLAAGGSATLTLPFFVGPIRFHYNGQTAGSIHAYITSKDYAGTAVTGTTEYYTVATSGAGQTIDTVLGPYVNSITINNSGASALWAFAKVSQIEPFV